MKVTSSPAPDAFKPVDITLTFQYAEEIACFFALFNHSDLTSIQHSAGLDPDAIKDALTKGLGKQPKYNPYHSQLCKVIRY